MKLIPFDVRHLDIFVNTWIYEKKYVVNLKFRSLLIMSLLVYKSFTCLFYFLMLLLFIHSFIYFFLFITDMVWISMEQDEKMQPERRQVH